MSETRRFKLLGPGGVEIARLLVPPDDAPIDVEILDGNVWVVLELQVIEEKSEEIPAPEIPTWEEISREEVDPRDVADQAEDDAEE